MQVDPPIEPQLPEHPDLEWAKHESTIDLNSLLASAQTGNHDLFQEGPFIKCRTPGHEHGHHIGVGRSLVQDPQTGRLVIVKDTIVTSSGQPAKRQFKHNQRSPIVRG